jgi:hypothetical protein
MSNFHEKNQKKIFQKFSLFGDFLGQKVDFWPRNFIFGHFTSEKGKKFQFFGFFSTQKIVKMVKIRQKRSKMLIFHGKNPKTFFPNFSLFGAFLGQKVKFWPKNVIFGLFR